MWSIHPGCRLSLRALPNSTGTLAPCHRVRFQNETTCKTLDCVWELRGQSGPRLWVVTVRLNCFGMLQISISWWPVHPFTPRPHPTTRTSSNKTTAPSFLPPSHHPPGHGAELPVRLLGKGEQRVNVMAAVSRDWKRFSFQCWCW